MASRIQGITVEIGGDTTKLSKALESVNKSIKGTQSGLKDVNKLLKLDPSNTELVVQKQKMLKDAIEATKEKLATLKTAAQQANEQLANGEITQQQYDALQREIVETEQNLRSLQNQAATTNATLAKIDEVGEKLQNIGSSVENVGKKFLTVTAAVTGIGTAAVKTAADFDSEMSKVSAISGATGDDFDQLRAKAREMGAKTKFSASEAASAMEYMAMAGWKTSDMLNGIEGIMNLAAASGEDLATTSDIVTDALTAFGLSAADSGHFADILAAASSNANTNVSMMGETFKYCAPIAGALGFSAKDTAEAIGLMANSGIKASQAGTSLRTIMNNLSGEVTFVGKNIGEVTIATSNADGSMRSLNDILADCRVAFSGLSESEKAANAEALVGKNAMSGFLALMNSSETDINKLRGAIENCDGASESMAETMQDNLNGQLTILKSQLEELAISFGDILMPTIRKIVSAVQQFVDLNGFSFTEIAELLTEYGRKTKLGNTEWNPGTIAGVIANERHCGDVLARKTFTPNFLTHKSKKNNNDRTQYRQRDHHEAIVSREVYNAANHLRASRNYTRKNRPLPVLSVVDDGILRGYVPFDKDWTGFSAEEYREASESVMQEEQENNAEVMNRLNLSGYEVVRAQYFSTLQNPAMTISNGKLRFNTSCLKKFEDVEYVELLLNSVDRCVAIRPCEKGNPNAIHWGRLKEGRWCASTLGCRGLAKTLFDIMEWEEGLKYRFRGQFVEQGDNKLMLFELDEPEMIKIEEIVLPSKEEEAEGKTVKQMIYIFPPEWAGTFGQPITSIAQVGILQQEHYAGNWDVLRPAAEIKEMNTFTADGLNTLLHEAEEIMEGWTDTNE